MRQVVRGPGGEQFGEGDSTERGMSPLLLEILREQVHRAQLPQAFRTRLGELIKQLFEGLTPAFAEISFPVKGRESPGFPVVEDRPGARNPIVVLGVNQVSHNIERAPRSRALITLRPDFGQPSQKRVEYAWSARQQSNGLFEIVHVGSVFSAGSL